ncbi:MAG: hypothetical protein AB7F50_06480 [Fimbriimonadaceae bacterium]
MVQALALVLSLDTFGSPLSGGLVESQQPQVAELASKGAFASLHGAPLMRTPVYLGKIYFEFGSTSSSSNDSSTICKTADRRERSANIGNAVPTKLWPVSLAFHEDGTTGALLWVFDNRDE